MRNLKKILTLLAVVGAVALAGCDQTKEEPQIINKAFTRGFSGLEQNTLYTVRNQAEYDLLTQNSGDSLPPQVDFSKYALLVVKGIAPQGVRETYTDVAEAEPGKYRLDATLWLNDALIQTSWVITSLIDRVQAADKIELNVILRNEYAPGSDEGKWATRFHVIRTKEELGKVLDYLPPPGNLDPYPVEFFVTSSLLLAQGYSNSGIEKVEKQFIRSENGKHKFVVTIYSNAACVITRWTAEETIPVLGADETVELEVKQGY